MFFTLLPVDTKPPQARARAFLVRDNWDDWGKYSTLFVLVVFDESGRSHDLGGVKIGQFGMKERQRRPNLPDSFDRLDETFFSLGQDESYYEGLSDAGVSLRDQVLHGLRDLAADPALFERAIGKKWSEYPCCDPYQRCRSAASSDGSLAENLD